jgi:sugar phosphate isomerase/epimerase
MERRFGSFVWYLTKKHSYQAVKFREACLPTSKRKTMIRLFSLCFWLLTVAGQAQPFGKLIKQHPGVVSYTFRNEFSKDVPATLDQIRQMGITNIEFSNLFGKTAPELRALLDQRAMRCSSYGVSYDDIQKKPGEVLTNAKTLGATFVRVAWIPHDKVPFDSTLVRQVAAVFNTFGQQAREQGLTFCYHNHGYEFAPHGSGESIQGTLFDELVRLTNPRYVSFEMDIAWTYLPGQDPAALLLKYPKRFRLIHLKDVRQGVPKSNTGQMAPTNSVALGTGQLDIPGILKAARKARVTYLYIEDESPAAPTQVPQSLAFMRGL